MRYYVTDRDGAMQQHDLAAMVNPGFQMNLVKLYPEIQYQEIIGFGGAFTEAAAYVWDSMGEKEKEELLEAYFGEAGNRYNFGRTHIQSCDFSLGNRSYVEEGDDTLRTFSIKEDYKYQIPFIKAALEKNPNITFLASPWSPPAFMKDNKDMNHGGRLLEEYYGKWAEMIIRYILAYREEGIQVDRVTVQNEPAAVQTWDSCIFTPEEEGTFAARNLRTALDRAGLSDVKILIWDHNKDIILERVQETLAVSGAKNAVDGIGFHWYTGDHFEALEYVAQSNPDKELIFTEGCVEYSRFSDDQVANAEMYAHDMIGNLRAGTNGFLDWNLLLDKKGGPNHVGNFCDAPIMCDLENNTYEKKLSYYYIGHFSRFIQPGARRILVSVANKELETVAFQNPDGSRVAVILNEGEKEREFHLACDGEIWELTLKPHGIMTVCVEEVHG